MCYGKREWAPETRFLHFDACKKLHHHRRLRRSRVRVHRFIRMGRWEEKTEREIEEKNLKLYLENKSILEENQQLRKKAILLRQENLALLTEFKKKFSNQFANPVLNQNRRIN